MTEKTQGHGYFRKKKWAKGLASGIAIAGFVAFSAGSAFADEAVQPESKNDNNMYATQAGKATGSQSVAIDNGAVTKAAEKAKEVGVNVSETQIVDKGTDTTAPKLEQSKSEIKQDQDKQVKELEKTTGKQVENNTAFKEAQETIQANNQFVADEKSKHEGSTTVTVTNDGSTATDGTAPKNREAATTAKKVLSDNKKAVADYLVEKGAYDSNVQKASELNQAVEAAEKDLEKKGVTVKVVTRTVSSVKEVEALQKKNDQAIAAAKGKVELNKAIMAAYTEKKNASDQVNQDADRKSTDLKNSGVLLTSKTKEVSSADEAKQIGKQNQQAYDQAKKAQADWQKKYDELRSKTSTEGYTKEVVLQALSLATANPNANVKSSASGAKELTTSYVASSSGNSGYGRILDSTKVLKYQDVGNGWKTEIDYTSLKGLTVSTADGQKHDISRIHRKFEIINQGETGLIDVYVLNDPTEGFVAARNDGIGTSYDYMRFRVTDTYYYNVDGKEVAFNASEKTPAALTYSSLNYNKIGWEGAGAVNGKNVEINGSTVTYHKNDGYNYADDYNTVENIGVTWDASDSPYQYKGAALGVFKEGTAFSTDFTQWDNYATTAGQTYWFALNSKVVAPVVEVPATATITKTTVKPGKTEPVSAELVKAKNPVKPTLALKTLSETKNQKLSASYHGYKLQYKPTVSKSVADTDKTNTDGQTVAKNAPQTYTLTHDNIYANVKKGDKITIIDPLEAGAVPDVAVTKAAAEKAGWGVAYDAEKNTYTFIATYEGKRLEAPVITWKPIYDKGFYDNTYKVLVNNYEAYSNTVTNYTPKPPKPVKSVLDHSGKDINGATTFDRNVTFRLMTDYSPYTKTLASAQALGKKFAILDDVQDKAFTVDHSKIKMTAAGKDVKNLFDMYHVLSDAGRTDAINKILKELNLNPKGEFYLWTPKDSASFYKNYVKQNKNVTIDLPAKLLIKTGEKVENDFKQIDFGNSYQSNLVTVEVPNVKPEKHVLDRTGKKVLDGKEVQLGDFVQYLLDGATIPERHHMLYQYDGLDKLDTKHDRYTGNWKGIIKGTEYTAEKELTLPYDVILKNGKVIKAGDKIAKGSSYAFTFEFNQDTNSEFIKKLVTVKWDAKGGQWSYVINQDFLNSLGVKGTFDADFYIEAERIETGDKIENTFINIVNKQEMTAKVITRTPEPPKPKHPEKHALDRTGKKVLDGKEVQLGDFVQYLLDGATVPERHHMLYQYDGLDKLDTKHDRYTGNWKGIIKGTEYTAEKELTLPYDVILKNGKVIKAGDKIAKGSSYAFTFEFNQGTNSEFIKKLVTVKWDAKGGQWSYVINQDFLNSLGVKGTFDADFYIEAERIETGDKIENTFINIVNKQEMTAKVITRTPEPPKPKHPEKHALDRTGKKVLDGKEVQLGDFVQYLLDGATVPERHHMLYQYDGLDKLDTKHDRYTGNWKGIIKGTEYTAEKELTLPYDVILKNGKVIKAGDKIAKGSSYAFTFEFNQGTNSEFIKKLVTVKWDAKGGQWSYVINQDFLNSLGIKGTFDADFYIEVERIETGDKIENTFINIVNKQEMTAKVITRTPEPPKPKHPEKHALDRTGKKVLDGKEVQLGDFVQYLLDGATVPERHHMLYQYDGLDKLDTKHDRYTGNWKGIIKGTEYTAEKELTLPYDVILKNGKVIKAGDKIAKGSSYAFTFEFNQGTNSEFIKKLVTVKWDAKGGQWSYVINQDFLNSLGIKGTFDADFYIEVERIETGDKIENTFINIVNKQEMTAKVITRTPEPPKPKHPEKHALDRTGKKVLDGKEVQLGDFVQYLLDGATIPERHHMLYQYDGLDKLDTKHDRYTGNWKGIIKGTEYTAEKELTLPYDVILKNGKVIKAGDKIAKGSSYAFTFEFNQGTNSEFIKKLVTVKWDAKGGQWSYVINQDFLNSLGVKGTFDADFYIEVERIAAGEVENTFVNIVNGQEMVAKVTTHTPEPPKPEEPGKPKQSLPNTGSAASMLPVVGMILGLLSLAGLRKYKK